jgi:hypothetical protein
MQEVCYVAFKFFGVFLYERVCCFAVSDKEIVCKCVPEERQKLRGQHLGVGLFDEFLFHHGGED